MGLKEDFMKILHRMVSDGPASRLQAVGPDANCAKLGVQVP